MSLGATGRRRVASGEPVNDRCNAGAMRCNDSQRAEAVALAADVGPAEAARRLGLNPNTLRSWLSRAGRVLPVDGVAQTATATATRSAAAAARAVEAVAAIADRKAALADALLRDAERMRRDLFTITTETVVLSGKGDGSKKRHTTTHGQRVQALLAIAKAVETVNLLTGEATQRIEQLGAGDGTPAPERAKAEETVLQLVQGTAA